MSYPQGNQQAPWATTGATAAGSAAQSGWQTQTAQQNPYDAYAASTATAGLTAEQQALLYQQQTAGNAANSATSNWQASQTTQGTSPWGAQSASSWAATPASQVQSTTAAAGQTAQQAAAQSPWSSTGTQQPWGSSKWGPQSSSWQAAPQTVVPDYQSQAKVWLGTVTQLIPPNYGIIDSVAFYVHEVVTPGTKLPQVGDRVKVEAMPATDGGQYSWRCTRVEVDSPSAQTPTPTPTPSSTAAAMAAAAASTPGVTANPYGATTVTLPSAKASSLGGASGVPTAITANKPFFRGSTASSSRLGISISKPPITEKPPADGKYNTVAPPTSSYTADLALAAAANAIESAIGATAATTVVMDANKKLGFAKPPPQLSEEERKKSEQAVQQLKNYGDPSGIGARLLTKMGFGAAGGQGLGKNEQGIAAPVDPKSTMGQRGLGFDSRDKDRGRTYDRRDSRRDSGWDSKRRRSYSQSSSRSRSRSRSYSRSRSRGRSRSRSPSVRYTCRPPKATTYDRWRGIASLSKRYSSMYIPSDFIKVESCWLDSCPEHNPLPLDKPVAFRILEEKEDTLEREASIKEEAVEETDKQTSSTGLTDEEIAAGRAWSAKVALMSGVNPAALHTTDARLFQHPVQNLKFLVGKRSKGELLLVGGQWEPEDGPPPYKDPWSLTRTAARTFKEATGLDLTQCTQWVKFAEAQYLRSSSGRTGTVLQRTVIFLVDVLSVATPIPAALNAVYGAENASEEEKAAQHELEALEAELKENEAAGGAGQAGGDKVDLNSLTVVQLQEELSKRGLDTKWQPLKGKKELVDRLREYLEQNPGSGEIILPQAAARKDAQAALTDLREKVARAQEKLAAARANSKSAPRLLDNPPCMDQIVVRSTKSARMQCTTYSLDALLDYTLDDTKETTFEVSLFAELFLEMLQTRFGRVIFKCLPSIIERMDKARQDDKKKDRGRGWDKDNKTGTNDVDKGSSMEPTAEVKGRTEGEREATADQSKAAADAKESAQPASNGNVAENEKATTVSSAAAVEGEKAADGEAAVNTAVQAEKSATDGDKPTVEGEKGAADGQKTNGEGEKASTAEGTAAKAEPMHTEAADAPASQPEPGPTRGAAATPTGAGAKRQLEGEAEQGESKKVKAEAEAGDTSTAHPTAPPDKLRLACRFFDEKCAGYLDLEDLEEILFMTVQDVSRRRVQQLVEAVCKRERMSYQEYADMVAPPVSPLSAVDAAQAAGDSTVGGSTTTGPGVVTIDGVVLDLSQVQQKLAAAEASRRRAEVAASRMGGEAAALRTAEAKLKERVKNLMAQISTMESTLAATSSTQLQMETAVGRCVEAFQAAQAALQSGCSVLSVPIAPMGAQSSAPDKPEQLPPAEVQMQDAAQENIKQEGQAAGNGVAAPTSA